MSSHDQVCHGWANQTDRNRKGHNMSYSGPLLYSYSTVIANRLAPDFYLFNDRNYSVSTQKQKGIARRAAGYGNTQISVVNCQPISDRDHRDNLDAIAVEIVDLLAKAKRARTNGPWIMESASQRMTDGNIYRQRFCPDYPPFDAGSDFAATLAASNRLRADAARDAEQRRFDSQMEQRTAWLAGGDLRGSLAGHPLLRLAPNRSGVMQTSWGVNVPLGQAKRIAVMARDALRDGVEVVPASPVRIGDFSLTRITASGTIIAGCHSIPMEETHRFAMSILFWNERMEVTSNQAQEA